MSQNELEFTGERLTTGVYEYWSIEHLHRYAIAMKLTKGKKVLDIASGEGYGTYLLSANALSIIGVDISETAIAHASQKYQKPNLSYKTGSTSRIPLEDNSVDVVVSFETIEHHDEHDKMMQEIKRVLTVDGVLIISSPEKKYYSDIPKYKNPYHVKELYGSELEQLLKKFFTNTEYLLQKTIFGSVISPNKNKTGELIEFAGNYHGITEEFGLQECPYILCIASDTSIKHFHLSTSVFYNRDMFELYTKLKEENFNLEKSNKLLQQKMNDPVQIIKQLIILPIKALKIFKNKK